MSLAALDRARAFGGLKKTFTSANANKPIVDEGIFNPVAQVGKCSLNVSLLRDDKSSARVRDGKDEGVFGPYMESAQSFDIRRGDWAMTRCGSFEHATSRNIMTGDTAMGVWAAMNGHRIDVPL